jgi:3-isopropylmalate/(R)-2-methylmalate dehydratase small subunit
VAGQGGVVKSFVRHEGVAALYNQDNVDTDAIIPSREFTRVSKRGLADGLFGNLRYTDGRMPDPDFFLNRPGMDRASIIVSGQNFGCGSSREHAVWALVDYGFRAVIARSFGTIFYGNCIANGIVPVTLEENAHAALVGWIDYLPGLASVAVDLEDMIVDAGEARYAFELSGAHRRMLMNGESPIDVTLRDDDLLADFEASDRIARPWLYDVPGKRTSDSAPSGHD